MNEIVQYCVGLLIYRRNFVIYNNSDILNILTFIYISLIVPDLEILNFATNMTISRINTTWYHDHHFYIARWATMRNNIYHTKLFILERPAETFNVDQASVNLCHHLCNCVFYEQRTFFIKSPLLCMTRLIASILTHTTGMTYAFAA